MLNKLRNISNDLVNNSYGYEHEKYELINNILKNDRCFFDMDVNAAYSILSDLGIKKENLKNAYLMLIDEVNL